MASKEDMAGTVTDETVASDRESFSEEPYRFVVIGVYLLAALTNCMPATTFSAVNSLVETKFNLSVL